MISLRKHIDGWSAALPDPSLSAYRALLAAVGKFSQRAVPALGAGLEKKLSDLDSLLERVTPKAPFTEIFAGVQEKALAEFSRWSDQAFQRHKSDERDLRAIIEAMAKAVESIAFRDERYALEVGDLTERLRKITSLNDLPLIKRAIVDSANSLTICVERMAETSKESLSRLSAQVEDYRSRLDKSEELATIDPLTGLANRRRFEGLLDAKIRSGASMCLILIDLNDFKKVNDRLGHLAGDDVLKNFAGKLQRQFPSADLVARWGGDEFAVIISSNLNDTEARVARIRRSPIGECKITSGSQVITVSVDASIGVVEWNGSEKSAELVARADASMYKGKHSMKQLSAS